jgi:hypothetical protein
MSRVFVLIFLSDCVFSAGSVAGPKVQRGNNSGRVAGRDLIPGGEGPHRGRPQRSPNPYRISESALGSENLSYTPFVASDL